ncbi:MAG: molybdopterin-dependent oxidoreductase [Rhodobacteraceae bacterium]|nr:molybdopterin-dependent oxidoreductase [Paracoccaceae bacterium]
MPAPSPADWRRPPNQNMIRRKESWPVVGETEALMPDGAWTVRLDGCVGAARTLTLDDLAALPQTERLVDIHCVTRWSKLDCRFEGVRVMDLLTAAEPAQEAVSVRFVAHSARKHDTTLTLADIQRHDPLIALRYDGAPLPDEHGGPVRIVTPGKYFYKSCKWLGRIELLSEHRLGYWESVPGYHDGADPWREERYVTGSIPPDLRERMIAQRRFGGRDLLSCVFDGEELSGLDAKGATLRNTSFIGATLKDADFSETYLVNARFVRADLSGAKLNDSDIMGVDFSRADLRGVSFAGAKLFGASFYDETAGPDSGARLDPDADLNEAQIDTLTDAQAGYVRRALGKT